jgi:hypothetical protein
MLSSNFENWEEEYLKKGYMPKMNFYPTNIRAKWKLKNIQADKHEL